MAEMVYSLGIALIQHIAGGEIFYKHAGTVQTHHLMPQCVEQLHKPQLTVEIAQIAMIGTEPRAQVVRPDKTSATAHFHVGVRLRCAESEATQLQRIFIAATGFALAQMSVYHRINQVGTVKILYHNLSYAVTSVNNIQAVASFVYHLGPRRLTTERYPLYKPPYLLITGINYYMRIIFLIHFRGNK